MSRARIPLITRMRQNWNSIAPKLTYVGLWASLAMLMVIFPFVQGPLKSSAFTIIFTLLLGAAVMTIRGRRWLKVVALLPFAASVASRTAFMLTGEGWLGSLAYVFATMTLAWVTIFLFFSLFETKKVTSTTLWEAVSVYILIGLTWASVYAIVEMVDPGSFEDTSLPGAAMTFPTLIYYSFVTLATLGYGDIVPMTQEARGLVIMEVLTGVLYMAMLISRLVGTWRPGKNDDEEE